MGGVLKFLSQGHFEKGRLVHLGSKLEKGIGETERRKENQPTTRIMQLRAREPSRG